MTLINPSHHGQISHYILDWQKETLNKKLRILDKRLISDTDVMEL